MTTIEVVGIYLGYAIGNVLLAKWNANIVARNILSGNLNQINHPLFSIGYIAAVLPQVWFVNFWFAVAILLLHGTIFPIAYNICRKLAPFNLSRTTTAKFDKTLRWLGFESAEVPDFLCLLISAVILIIAIHKLN